MSSAPFSLHNGDALEWLRSLRKRSVDLCLMDPPWASMNKHLSKGTTTRFKGRWFETVSNEYILECFKELWRVMKPNTHVYCHSDQTTAFTLVPQLLNGREPGDRKRGEWCFWKAIIWYKSPGQIGLGYHFRNQHEFILFFEKGRRRLNDLAVPDVLMYSRVPADVATIPTEKPPKLIGELIRQSSEPDELVIDPFSGSGTTGAMCMHLGRRFAGCELDPETYEHAKQRIEDAWSVPE